MKLFDGGASRRTTKNARLVAANDLVQRTLAQHGLAPQLKQTSNTRLSTVPPFKGLWSRTAFPNEPAESDTFRKDGAEFAQDTYSGKAGSRGFRTYVPASAARGASGVVVMLHGCTQSPEDFAAGTGMNKLAEQHRFVVVYPAQSRGNNAQSCWNWFSRGDQRRDSGEPEILAGMTRQVCAAHGVGRDRTFVAGLSAGAAMAVILGETYPDVFGATGVHSGLAYGAANDVPSAFAAMAGNASDPARTSKSVPTIVFHGSADATVHPSNSDAIVRQVITVGPDQTVEATRTGDEGGRKYHVRSSTATSGKPVLEHWAIEGLGHAWSGGQPDGSYTDTKGPDASAEMIRFFFSTSNG